MGIDVGPKITTDGLVLHIDSSNTKSYSGSGITIYNMVTGGIAGTLVNGPVSDVAYKKTFILDGTNDNIQMQLPSGIVTGSQISISLWAKWKSTGTTTATIQTLVDNQYQVADNIGFFIQDRPDLGSVLEWTTQPNNAINRRVYSTQIVGDGSWHHIVGTNDGTYSRLYVDGYETGTAKTSAGIATTQDILCIGNWAYVYSSPRYLNGSVSNFKVYNRALSSTEVLSDYFSTKNRFFPNENIVRNGLILSFDPAKFGSYPGTGNTIYDLSGFGNTGTFTNGPSFSTSNGGVITFDGVNDFITIGDKLDFGYNSYSFSFWVKLSSVSGTRCIFSKSVADYQPYRYALLLINNKFHPFMRGNVSDLDVEFDSTLSASVSTWYHIACVFERSSTLKLYVNGDLDSSASISHWQNLDIQNNYTFKIGSYAAPDDSATYFMEGSISNFTAYNRVLSATEIAQNFNALRERYNI